MTWADEPEALFPELVPMGQARLFDPPKTKRAKSHVTCPACGAGFDLHPTVAKMFKRCSACREAGYEVTPLL